jgi:hypothetical protein
VNCDGAEEEIEIGLYTNGSPGATVLIPKPVEIEIGVLPWFLIVTKLEIIDAVETP